MITSEQSMDSHLDGSISTDNCDENSNTTIRPAATAAQILHVQKEDKAVRLFRVLVILMLIVAASILASLTYVFTRNNEIERFENQFENQALEIVQASNSKVNTVLDTLEGVSNTATTLIKERQAEHRSKYPAGFLTFPDLHHHLATTRRVSSALLVGYLPHVQSANYNLWTEYSEKNQGWIREANADSSEPQPILPQIWDYPQDNRRSLAKAYDALSNDRHLTGVERIPESQTDGPFSPVWTFIPPPSPEDTSIINYNLLRKPVYKKAVDLIEYTRKPTFLDVCNQVAWFQTSAPTGDFEQQTVIVHPVFDDFTEAAAIVGHLVAIIPWRVFFEGILAPKSEEITIVMENTCEEILTYNVQGSDAVFVGDTDVHESRFDNIGVEESFAPFANPKDLLDAGLGEHCVYSISVYPTKLMESSFLSWKPLAYTLAVLGIFLFTSLVFLLFDLLVGKRQKKVMTTAIKHNSIVSSLFPKDVRDRMMAEVDATDIDSSHREPCKSRLKAFLNSAPAQRESHVIQCANKSKPIADLFPETTIMFADIAGFTAWSSTREPCQVFALLESIYSEFDLLANRYRVFKVETIGDCYVAVCGLPDPCEQHAVVMAKFSREALLRMQTLTVNLEVELGPDTADLGLRVGLHSGPVTAGVLRGDRARFQLFGDTMNTASRMESTGVSGKIQLSQETADLLIAFGKADWITPREQSVVAKGKGELNTYFLTLKTRRKIADRKECDAVNSDEASKIEDTAKLECDSDTLTKCTRMIDWMVEGFANILQDIAVARTEFQIKADSRPKMTSIERKFNSQHEMNTTPLTEVKEIIALPDYNVKRVKRDRKDFKLSSEVLDELREYVCRISYMYPDHGFHCFEHASHVTMSVLKLFGRIVAPDVNDFDRKGLHDHTYGITSDPLTRFAVVLAALIHDVDHPGVPNLQLVKEGSAIATRYNNQSIAEQNSVDLAWEVLMNPEFSNLRCAIYVNESEFLRFRMLLVNTVMATDIMDKQLKQLRNDRWENAFNKPISDENRQDTINRKATIVIEHLIQASDVAHTMQHWHVYRKWNENLFKEMYSAYKLGRSEIDPSEKWYEGELWFLDNYVIPLAMKLKECGVFGVSSDETLGYAQQNRKEWEARGRQVVIEMLESVRERDEQYTQGSIDEFKQ